MHFSIFCPYTTSRPFKRLTPLPCNYYPVVLTVLPPPGTASTASTKVRHPLPPPNLLRTFYSANPAQGVSVQGCFDHPSLCLIYLSLCDFPHSISPSHKMCMPSFTKTNTVSSIVFTVMGLSDSSIHAPYYACPPNHLSFVPTPHQGYSND